VRFPFTDLSSSKLRPALVIAPENKYGDVILAFISSVIKDIEDTDFVLDKSDKDFSKTGLKKASGFKMGKLATLSKDIVYGKLGSVSPRLQRELDERLEKALHLRN
jgi:mRNA interferase MazF